MYLTFAVMFAYHLIEKRAFELIDALDRYVTHFGPVVVVYFVWFSFVGQVLAGNQLKEKYSQMNIMEWVCIFKMNDGLTMEMRQSSVLLNICWVNSLLVFAEKDEDEDEDADAELSLELLAVELAWQSDGEEEEAHLFLSRFR